MSRRLLALPVALLALFPACQKAGVRRDAVRPLPTDPAARGAAPSRPALPSPLARPDPAGPVPVVQLPSAQPANPPGLLAPPVAPPSAELALADDRRPIRERIQERREERKERQKEPEKAPPTLPSPVAPKPAAAPNQQGADAPRSPVPTGDPVRDLYQRASDRLAKTPDYEARLVRREVVGGKDGPTEEIFYQFRQQPFSLYMRNTGAAGRGREVLYVRGKFDGKMHVVIGEGDGSLFAPTGKKLSIDPNSPLVTGKSRHKVTDAGMGNTLVRLSRLIEAGQARSLGKVTRKEYPYPLDGVELTLRPGDDPAQPAGGKQHVYFDPNPESGGYTFPVLVVTTDPAGREVEYYCFDRYRAPAGLTDADFHPDRLGRK
jgi:hypothetical protein